jgi:hypothetical protein
MSLLYGEGGRNAFRRLQQVVFETDSGCSLFLFDLKDYNETAPLLADSVSCFRSGLKYANMDPVFRRIGTDDFHLRLVRDGVAARLHFIDYHALFAIAEREHVCIGFTKIKRAIWQNCLLA